MSSICISNCLNDAREPKVRMRATYVNLHKWPELDAEFIRSRGGSSMHCRPPSDGVISCRQMYLRSYRFSRKQTVPQKTVKCFGKVKDKMRGRKKNSQRRRLLSRRKCLVWRKVKVVLFRFFNRLLSCSASVDVLDQRTASF
ncbi:uncharacterized protein LOC120215443 [Hibiscus syriacus]|uniref:uncharacterized protein LOC120215443 n=1 Tax=Hibiscus syriacus TaxID=106335 RepID=UPI0019230E5F|nr:uncharacterized protein LOC120215443 [Hibiscus syriacus]